MAKKNHDLDENEENNGADNVSANSGENIPDLTPSTEPVKEKFYDCRGIIDHKCHIGNRDIVVEKNKAIKLTSSEATILQHAGVVIAML